MRKNTRISGIDIIGGIPSGMHFCLFYQIKADLKEILIPWFKTGLLNNEFCIWISLEFPVEEAKEALRTAVPDLDVYLKKGQMQIICNYSFYAGEDTFDYERISNRWIGLINQALESVFDGLRTGGGVFYCRNRVEKTDFFRGSSGFCIGQL